MLKRIFLVIFVLFLALPILYAVVTPVGNLDLLTFNLSNLVFVGGFAKVTGVFTGYRGKVGNTVYQMWKGIQTFKTKSTPSNPQSSGQTTNRTLFSDLISCFKKLSSTVVIYFWNNFATSRESGWGNIIGHNQELQAGAAFDPADLEISKGSLPFDPISASGYTTASGIVAFEWAEGTEVGSAGTDSVMGYVYDFDADKWYAADAPVTRADEAINVTCPTGLTATDLHAFLVFYTGTLGTGTVISCSDSAYAAVTLP